MYCRKCGKQIDDEAVICIYCGVAVNPDFNKKTMANTDPLAKSKLAAGLFGIFLGAFGIHNFYLGFTNKALAQLLLTVVGWIFFGLGPIVASIWGLIEGIMILTGSINQDSTGRALKD
ncbi:MAG: TM2 domain-containing protein [Candidatus Izemoplasmatales bacterium]|jgi:TM2 domain-containing membrane protein YozV|nr:TM2 domain-containing protein [Candidatus Izemoplasmatales bacterium]MDD4070209.1 TM2 domain-containing protein [Candidatus Izemoplasmatales bacterium]MDY0139034.1 TM2 domain-containing protein [Candidatus Izemoplasmatales bacterium]